MSSQDRLWNDLNFMLQGNTELISALVNQIRELDAKVKACNASGKDCSDLAGIKAWMEDLVDKQTAVIETFSGMRHVDSYGRVLEYFPDSVRRRKAQEALAMNQPEQAEQYFPNFRTPRDSRKRGQLTRSRKTTSSRHVG